jgi:hypothetical protein
MATQREPQIKTSSNDTRKYKKILTAYILYHQKWKEDPKSTTMGIILILNF